MNTEPITWEEKGEMIRLHNTDSEAFARFVIKNMKRFDAQAWDMFITSFELTEDNIRKQAEMCARIFLAFDETMMKIQEGLSMRACIRMNYLFLRCADDGAILNEVKKITTHEH